MAAASKKTTVVVQYAGNDYNVDDIMKKAEKAFAAETKANLKDLTVYIKPQDGAAYYVANKDHAGQVTL